LTIFSNVLPISRLYNKKKKPDGCMNLNQIIASDDNVIYIELGKILSTNIFSIATMGAEITKQNLLSFHEIKGPT
jgi:hypothetical protein